MKRIAVTTFMKRGEGGSFQYGICLLNALKQLDPEKYQVSLWYSFSKDIARDLEVYPFEKHNVDDIPLLLKVQRFLLRVINKFFKTDTLSRQITRLALHGMPRWKPDVCIRLEQGYTPLEGVCKTVGPVHDVMHRYHPEFPEVASARELKSREYVFSNHIRTASAILVDSEVGKRQVLDCYLPDESRVFVLPFCASHLQGLQAQKPANFPLAEDQKFLFYPAQMWLHKNHVNLVRAVALLHEQLDVPCIFTGATDKSGYKDYQKAVSDCGLSNRIHHLGYVSDAEAVWLYKNARCMVMPTYLGPTNIPPLEAFLLGCPVAVSNVYGMPEQLGDAALYFDPHKPEEIADCIATLWTDQGKWNDLRDRGLAKAAAYSAKEFEQKFIDIITNKIG